MLTIRTKPSLSSGLRLIYSHGRHVGGLKKGKGEKKVQKRDLGLKKNQAERCSLFMRWRRSDVHAEEEKSQRRGSPQKTRLPSTPPLSDAQIESLMEQQQVKLSGAIPVCGGGGGVAERLAICAWKEPGGGSNELIASSSSVHLHLQQKLDLPELNPPLLHSKSSTAPPPALEPPPKPFLFHCVAPT